MLSLLGWRRSAIAMLALLMGLTGCADAAAPAVSSAAVDDLRGDVAALSTRVASLETQVAPTVTPTPVPTPTMVPVVEDVPTDGNSRGSADAPVTITEYMDYLCGYCARHTVTTARLLDEAYVKTGQVRVVAKQMPVHGELAVAAAEAALCAGDQGAFWEYHDGLMESLYNGDPLAARADGLNQLAGDLSLDQDAFSACLAEGKYSERVQQEAMDGQAEGVQGTPTFFVNELQVVGAQPYEAFAAAIEQELSGQ